MTTLLRSIRLPGLLAVLLPLAVACTVQPYDPTPGGGGGGGGAGGGDDTGAGPDGGTAACSATNAPTTVLAARCTNAACHDADAPAAGLDLASAGVAQRLMGVTSTCANHVLVVAGNPTSSYLMDKISGAPACGTAMPPTGLALDTEELGCVQGWITSLAGTGSGGGTGGGGTGGGGTGGW